MNPRKAALVGILFVAIAIFYYAAAYVIEPSHIDFAGFTMLIALGAAMSLMAYILFSDTQRS